MRHYTRFISLATLTLCSILYLAYLLPSFSVRDELHNAWSKSPRRLIVFGDSWSDNGQYPVDPPPKHLKLSRSPAQGKVWTEWLCQEISCNHHDNFARSLPNPFTSGYTGAVVDSSLLNSSQSLGPLGKPLADFKTQVSQWIKFEKKQYMSSRVRDIEKKGTIFTVWFSLWDLWHYSKKTNEEGSKDIVKTINTLFDQFDRIAENWPPGAKIIVLEAMDPTFLPGWHAMRTGPGGSDISADEQRNAVLLVEQWNAALDKRASRWDKGQMYIYNTNEWLLDQVREQQLIDGELSDHNGLGASGSPWDNVSSGCIGNSNKTNSGAGEHAGEGRCVDPQKYLFWDEMHFGPEAMKMIGEGIARDIAENRGDAWFAHEEEQKPKKTALPQKAGTSVQAEPTTKS